MLVCVLRPYAKKLKLCTFFLFQLYKTLLKDG